MNKSNIISHLKSLTVYTLILASVAGFLLYNMEKKARVMEREQYKQEIQELKNQAQEAQTLLFNK